MPKKPTKEEILQAYKEGKIKDEQTLAVFVMVKELENKIDEEIPHIKSIIERMKGEDGHTPTKEELLDIIKPLIPDPINGEDGYTPTDKDLLRLIKPLIPKIENGKTPTRKELLDLIMPLIPEIETDSIITKATERAIQEIKPLIPVITPDTRLQMIERINTGNDRDLKIKSSQIEGFEKLTTRDVLDRAISILDQRTQFLINRNTGGTWGSITGTLADQTDLQSALDLKLSSSGATVGATSQSQVFTNGITSSNLTAGRVVYTGTGGLITSDANNLWDSTNQRASIGIASGSTAALAITPKVATDRALLLKGFTGQSGNYIEAQNSAGTEIFKVNSVGSVFSKTIGNGTGYFIRNQANTLDVVVMGHDTSNGDLQIGGGGAFNGIWLVSNAGLFVNGAAQVGVGRRANDYVSNFQVYSKANGTIAMTLMKKAGTQTADMLRFLDDSFNVLGGFNKNYSFLAVAGTTAAGSAPIKFTSGTNMTTAEAGSIEFTTDDLFFTITTGAARKAFILDDGTRLTSGNMPIATTNGRLINANITASATSFEFNPTFADTDFNISGNTISMLHIDANGGASWIRPDSDNASAFEFRDAAGNVDVFYDSVSPSFQFNIIPYFVADVLMGGQFTEYKGYAVTGLGVPAIYGYNKALAQTAANASVAAYANTSTDGIFEVGATVKVITATTHDFTVTVSYTDTGNTARTLTLTFNKIDGTTVTNIVNAGGTANYNGLVQQIAVKASTTITIATTGTFTTVNYDIWGTIKQISR